MIVAVEKIEEYVALRVVMTVIRRIERFSHQAGKNYICMWRPTILQ